MNTHPAGTRVQCRALPSSHDTPSKCLKRENPLPHNHRLPETSRGVNSLAVIITTTTDRRSLNKISKPITVYPTRIITAVCFKRKEGGNSKSTRVTHPRIISCISGSCNEQIITLLLYTGVDDGDGDLSFLFPSQNKI